MKDPQTVMTNRNSDHRLTIVTKRTYRLRPERRATVSEEQVPVVTEPVRDAETRCLVEDIDAVITKRGTDLVVKGKAWAPEGRPVPELEVAVGVNGSFRHRIAVIGDRQVRWRNGRLTFGEPEPFASMPITYDRAYGGSDESARQELDTHNLAALQPYLQYDLWAANLCVYYRNTAGTGFLIHEGAHADGMALPNIEDPDDRLTASRLAVEDAVRWHRQPVPAGLDWYDYDWFPRNAFLFLTSPFGPWDELPRPEDQPIREQRMGYLPEGMFSGRKPLDEAISTRVLNGASPALVLPFLAGDEAITLEHMDAEHPVFRFQLPGERPRLIIKPLGEEPRELQPNLYSVLIDKERDLVSLVWAGSTFTRFPYGPDQMERVPYRALWS